ncbi:MAG: hypothetical protein ACR2QH_04040 [Geminicoccaceae bacterium]
MTLHIREIFINEDRGVQFGDSGWYPSALDDAGDLFRQLRVDYGAARNLYRDVGGGEPIKVGWVFHRRDRYTDTDERYQRSVWVEVSATEPKPVLTNVTSPWATAGHDGGQSHG